VGLKDVNGDMFELSMLGRLDIFKNFEIHFRKEEDFCFSD